MKAINIQWDVDDNDKWDVGNNDVLDYLPKEIEIPKEITDEEEISDYISNVAGFCHKGFELVPSSKKKFSIPVTWEVWDKVEVYAESIEEAIQYVRDNLDTIPLGTEPEYIDGSYKIEDGDNGEADMADTIKHLKEYWNLSGGIDGEDVEELSE